MLVSWRVFSRALGCGLVLALAACSSVSPTVNPKVDPSQALDPAACLEVNVQGPDTVLAGEGFTAQVTTQNVCDYALRVPIADATAIYNGEGTGVEISFHIDITDP